MAKAMMILIGFFVIASFMGLSTVAGGGPEDNGLKYETGTQDPREETRTGVEDPYGNAFENDGAEGLNDIESQEPTENDVDQRRGKTRNGLDEDRNNDSDEDRDSRPGKNGN